MLKLNLKACWYEAFLGKKLDFMNNRDVIDLWEVKSILLFCHYSLTLLLLQIIFTTKWGRIFFC